MSQLTHEQVNANYAKYQKLLDVVLDKKELIKAINADVENRGRIIKRDTSLTFDQKIASARALRATANEHIMRLRTEIEQLQSSMDAIEL